MQCHNPLLKWHIVPQQACGWPGVPHGGGGGRVQQVGRGCDHHAR